MRMLVSFIVASGTCALITLSSDLAPVTAIGQVTETVQLKPLPCGRDPLKYTTPRVALVVGNGGYSDRDGWADLGDIPRNDARDVASRLCDLGFDVWTAEDLNRDRFKAALREFDERTNKQTAITAKLFYFSGHGAQVQDASYLIPVGVPTSDTTTGAIRLEEVFRTLDDSSDGKPNLTKIVIVDACRTDKGFERRGLARPVNAPAGTLVAYATSPDAVASADGPNGRNSLYTQFLLEAMGAPGQSIDELLRNVRERVYEASKHNQTPWETTSTIGNFALEPPLKIDVVEWSVPVKDDLVILSVNDVPVVRIWRDQPDPGWIPVPPALLRIGDNTVAVDVYNDKTRRNGLPWQDPEGWAFQVHARVGMTVAGQWNGGENVPTCGRWGTLFRVLEGKLRVDGTTGRVSLSAFAPVGCR